MVSKNTENIQGGDHIPGKFFYFGLDLHIADKSAEQMHTNISAAEHRTWVSKGEAEQAKRNEEEASRNKEPPMNSRLG
jgi:hypothetical protein